jgi:hypothetical protein
MTEDENRVAQQRAALIQPDPRAQPTLPTVEPDRAWDRWNQQSTAESERQRRLMEEQNRFPPNV